MENEYIQEYAKLDGKAQPTFIEPKGYVYVGSSRNRLHFSNMPRHEQIRSFSQKLAEEIGYSQVAEKEDSLVVLLSAKNSKKKKD